MAKKFSIEKDVQIIHEGVAIYSIKESYFLYDTRNRYYGAHFKTIDYRRNGLTTVHIGNCAHGDANFIQTVFDNPMCDDPFEREKFGGLKIEQGRD